MSGKMQPKKENPLQFFKAEVEGRFRAEIGSMCDMRLEMTDGYCRAKRLGIAGSHQDSIARTVTTHRLLKEFYRKLTGQGLGVGVLFCFSKGSHCLLWRKRVGTPEDGDLRSKRRKQLNTEHMGTGQTLLF